MKTIPTLILFLVFQLSFAQSLVLDNTFNIGVSQNSDFTDFVVLPDGKLLVCGRMMSGDRLLRFNTDGSIDSTFTGSSANSFISKIVVDTQGRIYVMGGFTQYNGFNRNYLVRLNPSGSLDTSFSPSLSGDFGIDVNDVNFLSDGRIVVVGDFRCAVAPQNPVNFVVLSDSGLLDNSITYPYVFSSVAGGVNKVFVDASDNMYVYSFAGGFKKFTSNMTSVDLPYSDVDGMSVIECGFFKNNSELVIGGMIRNRNVPSNYSFLASISTEDFSFINGFANGAISYNSQGSYSSVSTIFESLFEHGGFIYGAGNVREYDSVTTHDIVRLDEQGFLDTSFDMSNVFQFYNSSYAIRKLAPYDSESFIVVGNFSSVNGVATKRLVRLKLNNLSTDFNSRSELKFVKNTLYAGEDIRDVELFDLSGRSVFLNGSVNSKLVEFNSVTKGFYIMKIILSSNAVRIQKVFIE